MSNPYVDLPDAQFWSRSVAPMEEHLFDPVVEPDGYDSAEAVAQARTEHMAGVRRLFEEADVLVFTLGLTEAWRSRGDGSVYPLAPGVRGGAYDPAQHAFVNLSVDETRAALENVLLAARTRNPGLRVILTVSPVPLAATYEPRHVAVSTTYSKSVLRVAVEDLYRRYDWIDYFPSYEVITASPTEGLYFEEDRREVNRLGVAHAMRLFVRHYLEGDDQSSLEPLGPVASASAADGGVICDEKAMDAARTAAGL